MSPKLAAQLARLDRMSPRERVVVTLCVCAVTWFIINAFVITPGQRDVATYGQLAAAQQDTLNAANQQLEGIRSGSVPPGDPALREQLAQVDKENLSVDASLRASQQYLVPAETMGALLQDLLRRDKRLELVSMQTLSVAPILDTSKEEASAPAVQPTTLAPVVVAQSAPATVETTMFRHGVQIVLRGNFLNVLDYLHEVEKLPWQMYWGSFTMDVADGALPTYSLSIYTLSLDKSWLKL
ncbi:MAG: biosis protein MshJ [Rhodocyclales bacterium]|nr:biosis protein MshJ [Rhodocyclales bacterium]